MFPHAEKKSLIANSVERVMLGSLSHLTCIVRLSFSPPPLLPPVVRSGAHETGVSFFFRRHEENTPKCALSAPSPTREPTRFSATHTQTHTRSPSPLSHQYRCFGSHKAGMAAAFVVFRGRVRLLFPPIVSRTERKRGKEGGRERKRE